MGEKESLCVPSDLLHHVYTFLVRCKYVKAAKALQKATEEPLAAQSDGEVGLLDFFAFYQERHAGKRTAVAMDTEDGGPPAKRKKTTEPVTPSADTNGVGAGLVGGVKKKKKKRKSREGGAGDSAEVKQSLSEKTEVSIGEGNGGVSGEEGEDGDGGVPMESTPASAGSLQRSTNDVIPMVDDVVPSEEGEVAADVAGGCGVNGVASPITLSAGAGSTGKKSKKRKSGGGLVPFKRVTDSVEVDPRLQDNSFEAKARSQGSWGEKANRDLKFTKGKSFRHEKTKKKRGTYKGGAIDTSVCSIKFDSD